MNAVIGVISVLGAVIGLILLSIDGRLKAIQGILEGENEMQHENRTGEWRHR